MRNKIERKCPECNIDTRVVIWKEFISTVYKVDSMFYAGRRRSMYHCKCCDKEYLYVNSEGIFIDDLIKSKKETPYMRKHAKGWCICRYDITAVCYSCGSTNMNKYKRWEGRYYLNTCNDCQPLQYATAGKDSVDCCKYCGNDEGLEKLPKAYVGDTKPLSVWTCVECPKMVNALA